MRKTIPIALATTLVLVLGGIASADIPRQINFQGRLANASGTPLTGSYNVVFRIFDAPAFGSVCHNAGQNVAANSGLFNVSIGGPAGINPGCDFSKPYWLEIQVGTDSAMSTRIPLTAAAYAFTASGLVEPGTTTMRQAGNESGRIPVSNGTVNANLNADMVDGRHFNAGTAVQTSFNADLVDGLDASSFARTGGISVYRSHAACGGYIMEASTCVQYTCGSSCSVTCPTGCTAGTCSFGLGNCAGAYGKKCTCTNTLAGHLVP